MLLFEKLVGVNLYVVQGEIWRLITPIFMHSGFTHMLFNSFSLVLFGPALERIVGKRRFILLYVLTGLLANVATLILMPLTYTHVGSSGAIYGLFGFYAAMIFFKQQILSKENSQVILTITAIGVIMTFFQPNINITAHLFGLLAGFLFGAFMYGNRENFRRRSAHRTSSYKRSVSFSKPTFPQVVLIILISLAIIGFLFK
jgi:membrane associated rhomboid family serine protease